MRASGPLRATLAVLAVLIAAAALLVRLDRHGAGSPAPVAAGATAVQATDRPPPPYASGASEVRVSMRFKRPPRSGLLFDLRTGRVLWTRSPGRRQPVASLAKMMTALVVVDRSTPDDQVLITPEAVATDGSKVGVLPPLGRVRLETLLHGLLLPSGNDAAVALAQHVGGSIPGFVAEMNAQGRRLGLRCTHFSSPDGLQDRGNTSCVRDLAVVARELLARPRLARIVSRPQAVLPGLVPHRVRRGKRRITVWRPGRVWFANHNPLIRVGYRGATGVKTGYTDAAGRCLVATARRGRISLGVVLLGSPDPAGQAMRLLDRGFRGVARRARLTRSRGRAAIQ